MDMPFWVMGLGCLALLGLLVLLIVLIVIRKSTSQRPRSDIEDDFDDRPRRRER